MVFLLALVIIGVGIGFWNQQQIQECHAEYDDDPTITVECEDAFTALIDLTSALLIGSGIVGLLVTLYRWYS